MKSKRVSESYLSKMSSRRLLYIVLVLLILSVFLLAIYLSMLVSYILSEQHYLRENDGNMYESKFTRFDPKANITSVGHGRIKEKLENDEYIFRNVGENAVLLSNFDSNEYRCLGSCICVEDQERRLVAGQVLRKSIIFLVAGLTSLVAYKRAEEYFEEECRRKMSSECHVSSEISSEVDECEKINDFEESEMVNDDEEEISKYLCSGKCLKNRSLKKDESIKLSEEFNCLKLQTTGEVELLDLEKYHSVSNRNVLAKGKFLKMILIPFCKKNSVGSYMYYPPASSANKSNWMINVRLCVGSRFKDFNPTIKCTKMRK